MVNVQEQIALALANLNDVSKTLRIIIEILDRAEYKMPIEEYFQTLLSSEKVKEAIISLEKVGQKQGDINNRF